MIYFIESGENGPIKIGFGEIPENRLRFLQTGNPETLTLIGTMKGSFDEERRLHKYFAAYRLKGEWFRADIKTAVIEILNLHGVVYGDNYVPPTGNERVRAIRNARMIDRGENRPNQQHIALKHEDQTSKDLEIDKVVEEILKERLQLRPFSNRNGELAVAHRIAASKLKISVKSVLLARSRVKSKRDSRL